ncbi:MAG: Ni/Fe hydrogenase subunit alpha [Planctomycetota bacterium]
MTRDVSVHVHHVTRVEGHGNIVVDVKRGKIEQCQWQVPEAPRFFEAMVRGRTYDELHNITSRICGICSIGHTFASLQATEAAMGIEISEQTLKMRKLLLHGENLQSHILHACYLALPDYVRVGSVIPLVNSHKNEVLLVVKLHRLANELCDIVGGRTTHPITPRVGGFTAWPKEKDLRALKTRLEASVSDLAALADFVATTLGGVPKFDRETEYIGLVRDDEYALYNGDIGSTDGGRWPVSQYKGIVNEYVVPQSTAKYAKHKRSSYQVGALARYKLNHAKLTDTAKAVAKKLGLTPACVNPYFITVAQVVECVHSVQDAARLIDELLTAGVRDEAPNVTVRAGQGVGSVDVPRGILFHDYTYDKLGVCQEANCVIPTNQNHASIQDDMNAILPTILDKGEKEIELTLEMLVRAHDPCISCSTHYLDVTFKK